MKGVFVSDCEGPISKNDNAYELITRFIPKGDKVFSLISKYDDFLSDIVKRKSYNAGDTLKLVIPFLKAFDVTDTDIEEFSTSSLNLISGTKESLEHITSLAQAFIVSTSYQHYIKALCKFVGFPFKNTYCTRFSIDKYDLAAEEKSKLHTIANEIASMPMIKIPKDAEQTQDLSSKDQETIRRLDQIFWKEISEMKIGNVFSEVTTIGGEQKAQAIQDIAKKLQVKLSSVMYVGDSITDVQALRLVSSNEGLAVSFNGNAYAVRNALVAVQSKNNLVTAVVADIFLRFGKEETLLLVENWDREYLKTSNVDAALVRRLLAEFPKILPKMQIVTPKNMEYLITESSEFRKKVRGEQVGNLG